MVARGQTFQADGELDVARANDVLNLEIGELGVEAELLDDARILARCQLAVVFGFLYRVRLAVEGDREPSGIARTAPVTTIFPEAKIRAVVFGSRMRIMTAAKRLGLYSAFRACRAIVFRSKRQSRLTVATIFLDGRDKPHKALTSKARAEPTEG